MTGFWGVSVSDAASARPIRVSISSTAFLLKAMARICEGGVLWIWTRFRIRAVTTVVLPLPGACDDDCGACDVVHGFFLVSIKLHIQVG